MLTRNFYLVRYELYAAGTSLAEGTFPVTMLIKKPEQIAEDLHACALKLVEELPTVPKFDSLHVVSVSLLYTEQVVEAPQPVADVPRGTCEPLPAVVRRFLSALDHYNELDRTVGGGWSTKKAGTIGEQILAASELNGRRKALEILLSSAPQAADPPEGYALISIKALEAWGKLDEVRELCRYPITPKEKRQDES